MLPHWFPAALERIMSFWRAERPVAPVFFSNSLWNFLEGISRDSRPRRCAQFFLTCFSRTISSASVASPCICGRGGSSLCSCRTGTAANALTQSLQVFVSFSIVFMSSGSLRAVQRLAPQIVEELRLHLRSSSIVGALRTNAKAFCS